MVEKKLTSNGCKAYNFSHLMNSKRDFDSLVYRFSISDNEMYFKKDLGIYLSEIMKLNLSYIIINRQRYRSNRPELFYKKGVLRNFAKFTRKHPCQSLLFNKFAGLRPATLLKRFWHKFFPVIFVKFLRQPFYSTPLGDCFWI